MSRSALGSAPVQRAGEPIVSSRICLQLLLARERDASQKCCLALWFNSIAKTGGAIKNRAMNRMKIFAILIGSLLAAVPVRGQGNVEAIVAQNVRPILPGNGKGGGVGVAVRMNGETRFFNYGFANDARNERVTADSIFNLGSVGKLFATTTLAEAVKRGELSLDDPVAKYVTELQGGGDIRRITLGELASHTSGLPDRPGEYERWHRGKYTWPDFVRFLDSWKADPKHEPGKQYLYSDTAMVLLRIALQRRFNTPFAQLMHQRLTGPLGMSSPQFPCREICLVAPCRGTVRRVSRAASRAWKGEHSSGEAPVKSIRRRAIWPRFSPRIWANLPAMAQ